MENKILSQQGPTYPMDKSDREKTATQAGNHPVHTAMLAASAVMIINKTKHIQVFYKNQYTWHVLGGV